ncbi:MAG: hypothetical protein ABI630_04695 [Betaproteobacteria bacterium]
MIAKLNREVERILGLSKVNKQLLSLGAEHTAMNPEDLDALVHREIQKFAKVAREANIKVV